MTASEAWSIGQEQSSKGSGLASKWSPLRCLLLHAVLTALVVVLYYFESPAATLIVGGAPVAAVFFFFVWVEARTCSLKITPISAYFLWQGFALGVSAVYIGTEILAGESLWLGSHLLVPEYVAQGYLIGLVGTLPLHAGMQWLRPPRMREFPEKEVTREGVKRLLPLVFVFYCVGVVVLALSKYAVSIGVVATGFQYAAHGALAAFVLIPSRFLRITETVRLAIVVAGTLILFAACIQMSSKFYLMQALVGLFFYVLQRTDLHKYVPATAGFLILIYLTVVAPTVNEARNIEYRDRVSQTQAHIEAFKDNSPLYTGKLDLEFYQYQIERLLSRQFEASSIAIIARDVDARGHSYLENFEYLKVFFIPRVLWPEKPYMIRGAWFTHYLGFSARETDSTVSIGMEAAGELYWSFGIPGVFLGMLLLGAMFGGLWRMAGADPRMDPLRMSLYMFIALTIMNLPEAASRMMSCISLFIVYGSLFFIIRPRRPSKTMVFRRPQFQGSR